MEQLLNVVTVRRCGWERSSLWTRSLLAQVLSTGETVRAEEIVLKVPDGRSVTTLVNATPIRCGGRRGGVVRRRATGPDIAGGAGAAAGRVS